jgi:hypothetical protein
MANGRHKANVSSILVTSFYDFMDAIHKRYRVSDWFFRGETNEYDTPFLPTVWRDDHPFTDRTPISEETSFSVGELEVLRTCQSDALAGEIDDSSFLEHFVDPHAPINLGSVDLFNWLGLAQHHNQDQRYPTRLVDVSSDPLVGLYFAVASGLNTPGFVWVFRYNFNDLRCVGTISERGATFLDVLRIDGVDGLPYHPNQFTLALFTPPFPNARLQAQSGLFLWNRAVGHHCRPGGFPIEIAPDLKPAIMKELEGRGYTRDRLFPT